MAFEGELHILCRDPTSVVRNLNVGFTRPLDLNLNVICSRVQRVFDELLDNSSGTLDNLASSDLVDEGILKEFNAV